MREREEEKESRDLQARQYVDLATAALKDYSSSTDAGQKNQLRLLADAAIRQVNEGSNLSEKTTELLHAVQEQFQKIFQPSVSSQEPSSKTKENEKTVDDVMAPELSRVILEYNGLKFQNSKLVGAYNPDLLIPLIDSFPSAFPPEFQNLKDLYAALKDESKEIVRYEELTSDQQQQLQVLGKYLDDVFENVDLKIFGYLTAATLDLSNVQYDRSMRSGHDWTEPAKKIVGAIEKKLSEFPTVTKLRLPAGTYYYFPTLPPSVKEVTCDDASFYFKAGEQIFNTFPDKAKITKLSLKGMKMINTYAPGFRDPEYRVGEDGQPYHPLQTLKELDLSRIGFGTSLPLNPDLRKIFPSLEVFNISDSRIEAMPTRVPDNCKVIISGTRIPQDQIDQFLRANPTATVVKEYEAPADREWE